MNSRPLLSFVFIFSIGISAQAREWSDVSGKLLYEAELVAVTKEEAVLRTMSGTEVTVPLKNLSQSDLRFLRDREIGRLGCLASMMYVRGGSIRNSGMQLADSAPQIGKMEIHDDDLAVAKDRLLDVLSMYQDGIDTLGGKNVRPGDVGELQEAFVAGITGDDELIDGVIGNIAGRLAEIEEHKQIGLRKITEAGRQHEKLWQQTLLPLIKEAAGSTKEELGFDVYAVRGSTTARCGILVKNVSGVSLHNLCIVVNSTIGFPEVKDRFHYVFVETLDANRELMLSWRLAGALIEPDSNPDMGDSIMFSAWSTEFSNTSRKLTLPNDISVHRKTRKVGKRLEWARFRLKLSE